MKRKLSVEILLTVAICLMLSVTVFFLMVYLTPRIIEEYCLYLGLEPSELGWYGLDITMLGMAFVVSVIFFAVLFLGLFGQKLAYIRVLISGIRQLERGEFGSTVELRGSNELTQLGEAINYLSESQRAVREKEKRLREEREELIRTLSHDIRTPLTSIMSYTELIKSKGGLTAEEQAEYLTLVDKKTKQIKELTDILLDGSRRCVEHFDDARLLFIQLADEFTEALEERFQLTVTLPDAPFSGSFDVGELRRIWDNLISNIHKYADASAPVTLTASLMNGGLTVRQRNGIKTDADRSDGFRLGLNSIRRIVQNYGGSVTVSERDGVFEIIILLSEI